MLVPLSRKEKDFLEYVEQYLTQEGVAPSYLEIKENFGFASFNSVQRYLKQLQKKGYIHVPGGNQKRAITILKSSNSLQNHLVNIQNSLPNSHSVNSTPRREASVEYKSTLNIPPESLSIPLFGKVAAGRPLEAMEYNEFIDIPSSMVRYGDKTFALSVEGESMVEDGILDGDVILVQEQKTANNGDIVVVTVDNEATVKRFFVHSKSGGQQIELRPANSSMKSFWFSPDDVDIRGIVVGLIRKF